MFNFLTADDPAHPTPWDGYMEAITRPLLLDGRRQGFPNAMQ